MIGDIFILLALIAGGVGLYLSVRREIRDDRRRRESARPQHGVEGGGCVAGLLAVIAGALVLIALAALLWPVFWLV
ncbi:hypothetical protein PUV54_00210 [Hyphococcus flavus]|uniref:Uncharacterized protein n=1 Tax=Hyphococcus flavus TaxID=1866326 RepID=A0AAF0CEP1_9PROT|nr:hypothetical protein [Hyphococcus flavus]WDI31616.1 hypothetical protein PUV54_00210 [Hyphococcus flavus]